MQIYIYIYIYISIFFLQNLQNMKNRAAWLGVESNKENINTSPKKQGIEPIS